MANQSPVTWERTPDQKLRQLVSEIMTDPVYAIEVANQIGPELYQSHRLVQITANFNPARADRLLDVVRSELSILMETLE